ncbi:PQQ-binding-like beta-propeller repeat protein [Actinoplanes sp. NPDC051851]|uniref:outer membrane protein assembly factor BamB family protein n=1 Tax=Actinoplanes sp. NPDC051851 TaxID=3154753 RepID=UPI003433EB99
MPADIDDLFAALGREADALPLPPPGAAIRRGRRRNRNRAALAASAVLLVVLAGVGLAVRYRPDDRTHPILPTTQDDRVSGMSPIGGPVVHGDGNDTWQRVIEADGRIYGVVTLPGGGGRVVAVDASTGAVLWSSTTYERLSEQAGLVAIPGALLVTEPASATERTTLDLDADTHVLDPETGQSTLSVAWQFGSRWITGGGMLVLQNTNGALKGFDLDDLDHTWRVPAGDDTPAYLVGTDEVGSGDLGPLVRITDGDLVQVTKSGKVRVIDIGTGKVRDTVATGQPAPAAAIADDGKLLSSVGRTLRETDLSGDGTRILYTAPAGWRTGAVRACGDGRLCLYQYQPDGEHTEVLAIDATDGEVVWRSSTTSQAETFLRVRGSRVLLGGATQTAVYDGSGRLLFAGPGTADWIDDDDVLWVGADGSVSAVSARDGARTGLGTVPGLTGDCAVSAEVLACPTGGTLRLWRFTH